MKFELNRVSLVNPEKIEDFGIDTAKYHIEKKRKKIVRPNSIYYSYRFYIHISSIEELVGLINQTDNDLIVSKDTITIYDDYVE